jgi:hypothetical protein
MKLPNTILTLLAAAILVVGIITAGCTEDAASGAGSSEISPQYTATSGETSPTAGDSGSQSSAGGSRQFTGQSFLTNETLLAAAAGKLSVSEQDLQNVLNSTKNATSGRPNLTAAAQQLGVTQQQLTDALGIHARGHLRSGGYNATRTST